MSEKKIIPTRLDVSFKLSFMGLIPSRKDGRYLTWDEWVNIRDLVESSYDQHWERVNSYNDTVDAFITDQSKPGYVYVVRIVDQPGVYKIGQSTNLPRRMSDFGLKLPFPTELVFATKVANCLRVEKLAHSVFAEFRMNGEWFKLKQADLSKMRHWFSSFGNELIEPKEDLIAIPAVS